eukprot:c46658_g1_i1.p1 GENE.c46658_g1_i1~~c46658_g1_i1.p1  ORF type:complete len:287 (-),score=-16.85 c46658_g1_i1:254-1114(-)
MADEGGRHGGPEEQKERIRRERLTLEAALNSYVAARSQTQVQNATNEAERMRKKEVLDKVEALIFSTARRLAALDEDIRKRNLADTIPLNSVVSTCLDASAPSPRMPHGSAEAAGRPAEESLPFPHQSAAGPNEGADFQRHHDIEMHRRSEREPLVGRYGDQYDQDALNDDLGCCCSYCCCCCVCGCKDFFRSFATFFLLLVLAVCCGIVAFFKYPQLWLFFAHGYVAFVILLPSAFVCLCDYYRVCVRSSRARRPTRRLPNTESGRMLQAREAARDRTANCFLGP